MKLKNSRIKNIYFCLRLSFILYITTHGGCYWLKSKSEANKKPPKSMTLEVFFKIL